MLVIRDFQKKLLAEHLVGVYEAHALEFVRTEYPAEVQKRGEEEVKALIRRAIAKAERYSLTRSSDVTGLIAIMLIFGEDFDARDPQKRKLLESSLGSEEKMKILLYDMIVEIKENAKAKDKERRRLGNRR